MRTTVAFLWIASSARILSQCHAFYTTTTIPPLLYSASHSKKVQQHRQQQQLIQPPTFLKPQPQRHIGHLHNNNNIPSSSSTSLQSSPSNAPPPKPPLPPKPFSILMTTLPIIGLLLFPQIEHVAQSFPRNSPQQIGALISLFVGSKVYLYVMAVVIVALAGLRGAGDDVRLGERITGLTDELFYRPSLLEGGEAAAVDEEGVRGGGRKAETKPKRKTPAMIQSMKNSGLSESLDGVSTDTQALLLPLLVSALLALSVVLVPIWNQYYGSIDDTVPFGGGDVAAEIQKLLSYILPKLSQIWNAGLLTLFTRQEIRRLGFELGLIDGNGGTDESSSSTESSSSSSNSIPIPPIDWILAILITGIAFTNNTQTLWPVQNFVNMALAILVARSIQLDRFPAVLGALSLLTLYDASSVFFIPAAANAMEQVATATTSVMMAATDAAVPPDTAAAAASASAMGSVAIQKLTSGTFQPGLLVVRVAGGRLVGGGLGLGDAVFPSLLVCLVRRFDLEREEGRRRRGGRWGGEEGEGEGEGGKDRISLFTVSITGYVLGCIACELVPPLVSLGGGAGLPALVFIVPVMLGSVLVVSALSGELKDLWNFSIR